MVAFWGFAFKYYKSSCTMPGVFGGKEISEKKNKCLTIWNYTMIIVIFIACSMGYTFMLTAKIKKAKNTVGHDALPKYELWYIILSMVAGAI